MDSGKLRVDIEQIKKDAIYDDGKFDFIKHKEDYMLCKT